MKINERAYNSEPTSPASPRLPEPSEGVKLQLAVLEAKIAAATHKSEIDHEEIANLQHKLDEVKAKVLREKLDLLNVNGGLDFDAEAKDLGSAAAIFKKH